MGTPGRRLLREMETADAILSRKDLRDQQASVPNLNNSSRPT